MREIFGKNCILDDEEPRELFRRVTKLAVALRDHGSKDMDDNWIKRKFLKAKMLIATNSSNTSLEVMEWKSGL